MLATDSAVKIRKSNLWNIPFSCPVQTLDQAVEVESGTSVTESSDHYKSITCPFNISSLMKKGPKQSLPNENAESQALAELVKLGG